MKKIITGVAFLILLASCSTLNDKEDIYKNYSPKYSLDELEGKKKEEVKEKVEETKIDASAKNEDILNNENLRSVIFDRSVRKINKNVKGVWVASVVNLDFPKTRDVQSQKREIENIMENAKNWGLNAVFFHVRPASDALYNSEYEPWSIYLTGTQNEYPGYDPLAYAIQEAHKRGLELHAWINPYRASMNTDLSKLSDKSVVKKHPEWIFEFDGKYYLNPGNPEVVRYVSNAIEEIVIKYDVDGLHLDDYFYPYPGSNGSIGDNVDQKEYDLYASNFSNRGDWRRDNVNNMIKNLSVSVHKIKPTISFGVSPFGIWRNETTDPKGSKTSGLQSYDALYADSVKWMQEGWVDYIAPQIYWNRGFARADYEELVKWWNKIAKETNTTLYVGQGTYKAGEWQNPNETAEQLKLNNSLDNVNGTIFFRYETLLNNPRNVIEQIKNNIKK